MASLPEKTQIRVWLARKGKDQRWLAKQVRVSESLLSLFLDGKRIPKVKLADRIEAITGVRLPDKADAELGVR